MGRPDLFLVTGDPSGDRHAAKLVAALRRLAPGIEIAGLGGDACAAAGMRVLYNLPRQMAIMGFWQVLFRLPRIGRLLDRVRGELFARPPRLVVVVDYPGFNFQVAEICARQGLPLVYYITPQVWAWAPWRVARLGRLARRLLVIFPFEEQLYRGRGIDARFVGHPLAEELAAFEPDPAAIRAAAGDRPVLGLFPGSRSQEIRGVFPVMLRAAERLAARIGSAPALLVGAAAPRHLALLESLAARSPLAPRILLGHTHSIMRAARLSLVTSGTATLETAYLGCPMVILYRVSLPAWLVARGTPFLRVPHFGLANIVAGRRMVPEHLFWRDISGRVAEDARALWEDGPERARCLADLAGVREKLTTARPASDRAAEEILALLSTTGTGTGGDA